MTNKINKEKAIRILKILQQWKEEEFNNEIHNVHSNLSTSTCINIAI